MIRDEIERKIESIDGDTRLAQLRRTGLLVLRETLAPPTVEHGDD